MKKRFYSIDAMKVIAAFLVICIHIPFPGVVGELLIPIARIAVPFFFIVSGFFLWNADENKIKKNIVKIFKITLIANIIYFVWESILTLVSGIGYIDYISSLLNPISIITSLLLNVTPFASHLWYLPAFLYTLIIYYFVRKSKLEKLVYIFIPILLLIDLVFGKYSLLFLGKEFPYFLVRNFAFVGIPYFFIGNFLRETYTNNRININNREVDIECKRV